MPLRLTGNAFICLKGCRRFLPKRQRARNDPALCKDCLLKMIDQWWIDSQTIVNEPPNPLYDADVERLLWWSLTPK